ncbi:MAG: GDP-mannose 4,6-dehydratase [Nanoarchaeota archaeon]|nr:GDP-mannose 4,6-dehydratase [Nanoarchaeota archaeon]
MENWHWNGKVALITGIGGQDGSYLAEFLLSKGYKVRGIVRRASFPNTKRIDHLDIYDDKYGKTDESPFYLLYADLSDGISLKNILNKIRPDEIYNLGAQSHVGISFQCPESTINYNTLGPLRILESIKDLKLDAKYYQASSSEMFGKSPPPQNEETRMIPQSPYGVSKLAAFHLTRLYREAYGLKTYNGILFNHESPRRGLNFVTKKITASIASILVGTKDKITLGNLDAKRDWGFAKEYVEGMWHIMQHETPDDFVIATKETHTVREFLEEAFNLFDLNWKDFVKIDDKFKRPAEVPALLGDGEKTLRLLNWEPKTKFKALVRMMIIEDLKEKLNEKGLVNINDNNSDEYYINIGKEIARKICEKRNITQKF